LDGLTEGAEGDKIGETLLPEEVNDRSQWNWRELGIEPPCSFRELFL
jgi:hypothetical protein